MITTSLYLNGNHALSHPLPASKLNKYIVRNPGVGETKPRGMGTLGFLAPECRQHSVSAHPSQDVFSLGAMIILLMVRPDLVQSNMFAHPVSVRR